MSPKWRSTWRNSKPLQSKALRLQRLKRPLTTRLTSAHSRRSPITRSHHAVRSPQVWERPQAAHVSNARAKSDGPCILQLMKKQKTKKRGKLPLELVSSDVAFGGLTLCWWRMSVAVQQRVLRHFEELSRGHWLGRSCAQCELVAALSVPRCERHTEPLSL